MNLRKHEIWGNGKITKWSIMKKKLNVLIVWRRTGKYNFYFLEMIFWGLLYGNIILGLLEIQDSPSLEMFLIIKNR